MMTEQQKAAVERLRKWKVGALFMDAGTGKTRVALELANEVACDLVLFIAPLRTLDNARDEVSKWGGFQSSVEYIGIESIGQSDRIYLEVLDKLSGKTVFCIIDESIKIKSFDAKRTKKAIEIGKRCEYRMVLNGTPITRNLLDVWAQMEFLSPLILRMSLTKFKNTFCHYTSITKRIGYRSWTKEYITGYDNIEYLYSLISNYIYECDLQLNVKTREHRLEYNITDSERSVYLQLKEKYLDDETMEARNNNIFLEMTSAMQHSYCIASDKFRVIDEIFKTVEPSTAIIFCRFVKSADECRKRYPDAEVLSFQKEALGLNLQQYSTIIYFDKIWDYALMIQSGRRIYRTGQQLDCHFYHLDGDIPLDKLIDKNVANKVSMTEFFKKISKKQLYECI